MLRCPIPNSCTTFSQGTCSSRKVRPFFLICLCGYCTWLSQQSGSLKGHLQTQSAPVKWNSRNFKLLKAIMQIASFWMLHLLQKKWLVCHLQLSLWSLCPPPVSIITSLTHVLHLKTTLDKFKWAAVLSTLQLCEVEFCTFLKIALCESGFVLNSRQQCLITEPLSPGCCLSSV